MEAELKEILNDPDSLRQSLPDPSSIHMVKCNCICLFSLLFRSITNNHLFTNPDLFFLFFLKKKKTYSVFLFLFIFDDVAAVAC